MFMFLLKSWAQLLEILSFKVLFKNRILISCLTVVKWFYISKLEVSIGWGETICQWVLAVLLERLACPHTVALTSWSHLSPSWRWSDIHEQAQPFLLCLSHSQLSLKGKMCAQRITRIIFRAPLCCLCETFMSTMDEVVETECKYPIFLS